MQETDHIESHMLELFVDGELDAAGSQLVIQAMDKDPEVRERVYRLRRAKDLMKLGFGHAQPQSKGTREDKQTAWRKHTVGLAASLAMLAIGMGAGLLGYLAGKQIDSDHNRIVASILNEESHRVILHISESNPVHFARALDYVKNFINEHEERRGEIAVVAHSTGIDLMRTGVSPYEDQVRKMIVEYDNIHFIACANAIRTLQKKGIEPVIMRDVDTSKPAMDQIIEHVQDGWEYIKVKTLVSKT